ncbi:hypothetical protein K8942_01755 [Candidatus Peribacteria bacterium]|nr:MAG: hypothetical protein K8942_01755 [Candidatus Peribacteria bacterium]
MPLLLAFIGLIAPRFTIFILWLASTWFTGVFDTRLWPILGFLFLPFTLLWYSVVVNWFGGQWEWVQVLGLVLALVMDLSSSKKSTERKR